MREIEAIVGDRVQVRDSIIINDGEDRIHVDNTGTIKRKCANGKSAAVEFDDPIASTTTCPDSCKVGHGYYIKWENLRFERKAKEQSTFEFKPLDMVTLLKNYKQSAPFDEEVVEIASGSVGRVLQIDNQDRIIVEFTTGKDVLRLIVARKDIALFSKAPVDIPETYYTQDKEWERIVDKGRLLRETEAHKYAMENYPSQLIGNPDLVDYSKGTMIDFKMFETIWSPDKRLLLCVKL